MFIGEGYGKKSDLYEISAKIKVANVSNYTENTDRAAVKSF